MKDKWEWDKLLTADLQQLQNSDTYIRMIMLSSWILPLNNSLLMREKTLKSRSGVMMAVTLPSMLPIPNSRSIMKYSTDHSWDKGMFLMASLYTMKAKPVPSTAWNTVFTTGINGNAIGFDPLTHWTKIHFVHCLDKTIRAQLFPTLWMV